MVHFILTLIFCSVVLINACKSPSDKISDRIRVTVYGGAEQVSGSLTLIEAGSKRYLVDCGLYYPEGEGEYEERQDEADKKNEELPFDAWKINAVFVTHAHLDHIGRIPLLVENGFKGKIYCTYATKPILGEMLFEQIRYDNRERNWEYSRASVKSGYGGSNYVTAHWNNCRWQNQISGRNLVSVKGKRTDVKKTADAELSPCKECAELTLNNILPLVESVDYGIPVNSSAHTKVTFLDAGHIPGSASLFFEINLGKDKLKRLLFSGDVGNYIELMQKGPMPVPEADAVWMESTYGAAVRDKDIHNEFSDFQNDVSETFDKGGIAWIPAFALDRTQKILYLLNDAKKKNILKSSADVYCPSPTAFAITMIYEDELKNKRGWFKENIYNEGNIFGGFIRELPEEIPKPCILITTSGMMDAAYSDKLLNKLLPDASTKVFLVGYQDPCTPGGQLKQGAKEIQWDDKIVKVKAEVRNYGAFSAHADADDLFKWLSNQTKEKVRLFLVHGELSVMKEQQINLKTNGFKNVFVTERNKTYDFSD